MSTNGYSNAAENDEDDDIPGTIVSRGKKGLLTIILYGKWYSTGLPNTDEGWTAARLRKADLFKRITEGLEIQQRRLIDTAFAEYYDEKLLTSDPKYVHHLNYCYRKIVQHNHYLKHSIIEQDIRAFMGRKDHDAGGKNNILGHFAAFLNWCVERRYMEKLSVRRFFLDTDDEGSDPWTRDEIERIVAFIDHGSSPLAPLMRNDPEFADLIMAYWHTGARFKELVEQTWKKHVHAHGIGFANKKSNKASTQYIPWTPELQGIYDRQRERTQKRVEQARRRQGRNNAPSAEKVALKVWRWSETNRSTLHKKFCRVCEILAIDRRQRAFHAMRAAFATDLFDAEVPLDTVQDLMRHEDINTTIRYYRKKSHARLEDGMNRLGNRGGSGRGQDPE